MHHGGKAGLDGKLQTGASRKRGWALEQQDQRAQRAAAAVAAATASIDGARAIQRGTCNGVDVSGMFVAATRLETTASNICRSEKPSAARKQAPQPIFHLIFQ